MKFNYQAPCTLVIALLWPADTIAQSLRGSISGTTASQPNIAAPPSLQNEYSSSREGYTVAFVDADIRRVVDAILGEMLKVDYSVDPQIQGKITLRTAKPVYRESLLPLLENALIAVDAAIVVNGSNYRVVQKSVALTSAPVAAVSSETSSVPGFANEVITLKNASPREMSRLLEQFLGKGAVAGIDPARNQITITGTMDQRAAASAMVARFDVDAMAGMNFSTIKLENVDPDTLVSELNKIFQPPYDIIGSRVRLVPLPRMRSILLIAADRSDIARIEPWIRRLDAGSGGKPKLYSYAVQNGRARDLAASLQLVLGSRTGFMAPLTSQQTTARSNESIGDVAKGAMSSGDSSLSSGANQASWASDSGGAGDGPRIVPNEESNLLLIYATGEQYDFIREILQKIDRPMAQILIEATFAEITLTQDLSLGVDWSFISGNSTATLSNTRSAVPTSVFPGFSYGYIGLTAQAVLNTLQSKTNVRVLSEPKMMVLNNHTATLQVGDQVPIVVQQSQSVVAPGAPAINSVEMRDTGVILRVTPRVNDNGSIVLDVVQEVSDATETTTSGINSPTIQQRRLSSTVVTRSGQMVVLGGLIRDQATQQKSGVPFLSQIPVLGAAFGQQKRLGKRTELIVLITPSVLRSPEETREISEEVIHNLDLIQPLVASAKGKWVVAPSVIK